MCPCVQAMKAGENASPSSSNNPLPSHLSHFKKLFSARSWEKDRIKAWLSQGTWICQRSEVLKIHTEQSDEYRPQLGKMRGCHYKKCLWAPHLFRQTRCNPQLAFRHHYLQVPAPIAKQCCSAPLGCNCLMASKQLPAAGFQEQSFSQQNKKQTIVCFFFFLVN